MPFTTDNLTVAAFVNAKGIRPDRTEGSGTAVRFVFDRLTEREAAALLHGPDFELCSAFRRAWASCRRMIEAAQGNGGRR